MAKVSKAEKQWMLDDDIRTLEKYQSLVNDPKRLASAQKGVKSRIDEYQSRIDSLQKTTKVKPSARKR